MNISESRKKGSRLWVVYGPNWLNDGSWFTPSEIKHMARDGQLTKEDVVMTHDGKRLRVHKCKLEEGVPCQD